MAVETVSASPGIVRASLENYQGEPLWLREKRQLGLSFYEKLPVPPPPSRERNYPVFMPGELSQIEIAREIPEFEKEKDILTLPLEEAVLTRENPIQNFLAEIFAADKNKWIAFNQAFWRGGAFVYVPKNQDGKLLRIFHRTGQTYSLPRVLVFADAGSKLSIVEHYEMSERSGIQSSAFVAPVVEIIAAENSEVHYAQIQEEGEAAHHYSAVRVAAEKNSRVTLTAAVFGGKRTVNRWEVCLKGEGSQGRIFGLVFGRKDQIFEHYTFQEHRAAHTESDLLLKVALKEKAYSNFDGLIRIEKGAKKSSAYQQNRNLLLSGSGKADSTPRLEILDDDVRCTHGAAIGPVDEEQRFYLESRGISPGEAEALLVEGFFEQLLSKIPTQEIQYELKEQLIKHLDIPKNKETFDGLG